MTIALLNTMPETDGQFIVIHKFEDNIWPTTIRVEDGNFSFYDEELDTFVDTTFDEYFGELEVMHYLALAED